MDTDSRFVLFHGDNAQGKTNLLESVHVLATLKSFRDSRSRRWIKEGVEEAKLTGMVETPHGSRTLEWTWRRGDRQLSVDGTRVHDLQAWFGIIGAVVFCPEDITIIRGEPARRRQFIDRAAFTLRPTHLLLVQNYTRLLRHKAALLRQPSVDPIALDTFDAELARLGARLICRRRAAVETLRVPFAQMVNRIAGHNQVSLSMRSSGLSESGDEDCIEAELLQAITNKRQAELVRRQVLVGPHRDDLNIRIADRSARYFASQGQARTMVLALKLALWAAVGAEKDPPLFLLDDLSGELDEQRRCRLVDLLADLPGQVWITTTDRHFLARLPTSSVRSFAVLEGRTLSSIGPTPVLG
jgi:DNA replication and repair protein RecF